MLGDILTHQHLMLLQIIIQQSWYHFFTDFLLAQTLGDNLPIIVLFHVKLTCDHLKTNCLTHWTLTSVLLVEGLLLFELPSTFSCPSLYLLCFSKHVCMIWSHFHTLAEPFQVLVMEFFSIVLKISVGWLLHYSFLNANSRMT